MVTRTVKRPKLLKDAFSYCEKKSSKRSGFVIVSYNYFKEGAFTAVKREAKF